MRQQTRPKVELLAPAGNFEKLEIAIHFGADAVYLAGKNFSLRNFSGNFTRPELKKAVIYAHQRGVRVYVACNTYARSHERESIQDFLAFLKEAGPDADDDGPATVDVAYGPPPADAADDVVDEGMAGAYGPPPTDASDDVIDEGMSGAYGPPPTDASDDVIDEGMSGAYGPPPTDASDDVIDEGMAGAYGPPPDGG